MSVRIVDYAPLTREDWEDVKTYTLSEALQRMVGEAPDYHDGRVEAMESRVTKLTELLGALAEAVEHTLDDEKIKSLVGYPLMVEEREERDENL